MGTSKAEYLGRRIAMDPLRSWFYSALDAQNEWFSGNLTYYEFGVGWGGTLLKYISALRSFCRADKNSFYDHNIYMFDSFEGLPPKLDKRDDHPHWRKRAFAHGVEEIENLLEGHSVNLSKGNIHFVKGYYDKTLSSDLRSKVRGKPSIVTIDVDYYSSTITVLEWLRPVLADGVLFYFDDIWSFYGDPNRGELAAIKDFNKVGKGKLVPYFGIGPPNIWPHIYAYVGCSELENALRS